MFELLSLVVAVAGVAGLIVAIGTRDKLRTLEFRMGLLEKHLRDRSAEPLPAAGPPPTEELPPQPAATAEPIPATPLPEESREAEPAMAEPPPVSQPTPSAVPVDSGPSLEERFGTQWVVWGAGIAITIGAFLVLRVSIEQGWFGPGVRVALGALLAAVLIGAGEWARRNERFSGFISLPSAHIPSILTAVGTTVAFADIWAAYGLYDLIGSATAFVLLGLVALSTLAAALLHGPALAGLGLVGAYVTPLIVASDRPNYWALYLYLAVVTAAAFVLARAKLWRWLALTAVVFGLLWTLPGIGDTRVDWLTPHNFHVVAGFVLAAIFIVTGLLFGPDSKPGEIEPVSCIALAAYLLGSATIVIASLHDGVAVATFVALVAATLAIAWRAEAAAAAVPAAAVLAMLVFAHWAVNIDLNTLVVAGGPGELEPPSRVNVTWHLVVGALFSAMFGVTGFLAQGRSERAVVPMIWSASAVFAPLGILIALYYRIAGFERSIPFAGVALLLAVLFSFATETLDRRAPRPGIAGSAAIFATGAVAALCLALTMSLEKGWLTIALSLMVPGIAFVSDKRPLPALRVLAGVMVALVLARVAWEPRIVGGDVGTTPIFNWILYGYGVPTVAFWIGGHILRRRADDWPARLCDSAALLFGVLLVFLEIRHYATSGDIYRLSNALNEMALHVSAGFAITIGLEWLRERTRSVVHNIGAQVMAVLTLVGVVVGLGFIANPLIWPYSVGGVFFNLILLGYGLPAILAVVLALVTWGRRPLTYSRFAAMVAVALGLAYLTLEVRTLYHGEVLWRGGTSDAEQYTYSAVWLAFGVLLLGIGYVLKAQSVRMASAAVVVLTVVKVGLVDMSNLTGLWQALSVLGLGFVLLGIGWFYQRLLFPRRLPPAT